MAKGSDIVKGFCGRVMAFLLAIVRVRFSSEYTLENSNKIRAEYSKELIKLSKKYMSQYNIHGIGIQTTYIFPSTDELPKVKERPTVTFIFDSTKMNLRSCRL